jgi:hypothetical protein
MTTLLYRTPIMNRNAGHRPGTANTSISQTHANSMKQPLLIALAVLTAISVSLAATEQNSPAFDPEEFATFHALIKPSANEAQWSQVSWMPSTDLWAARQKAAAEGKPLFLWYMAGEPLGTC